MIQYRNLNCSIRKVARKSWRRGSNILKSVFVRRLYDVIIYVAATFISDVPTTSYRPILRRHEDVVTTS